MSAVENPTRQITKQDLRDFYDTILPYLGGNGGGRSIKTAVLIAGSTSVTFTDMPTSGDYVIDFYTTTGINYTAINTTSSTVTLTFEEQESDVTVYCEIKEV